VETYARLSPQEQKLLLDRIVERCHGDRKGPTPVVVFDLDGTLMDNRPRTAAILRELSDEWKASHPSVADQLATAEAEQLAYLLTDSLGKLGVTRTELIREAEVFWRERFFTDGYLAHDVEVPGAAAFARDCYEAGGILVYFTGRDLPLMGLGSFASLRDLGFPIGVPGTELVLKPDAQMPDEAFKRMQGPALERVGRVVAIFDNEPGNCNVLGAHFPEAEAVLLDTQHLPGAPQPDPRVRVIPDFRR
jgi:beta-phosphoglucomutase-like phosphatase (HAD superfamily)